MSLGTSHTLLQNLDCMVPVAARSKGSACGRALAEIVGSGTAEGMDICPLCVCCILSGRGLCGGPIPRPEESYGYLSIFIVVFCQVEVSAAGPSPIQRSPMDICRDCCVLSGRGLCGGPIRCPEESYGYLSVVCVIFCQVEISATVR